MLKYDQLLIIYKICAKKNRLFFLKYLKFDSHLKNDIIAIF